MGQRQMVRFCYPSLAYLGLNMALKKFLQAFRGMGGEGKLH